MTKLAAFVLSPLGILFLLLVVGYLVRRRPKGVSAVVGMGIVWLYVWSCPWVAGELARWWEGRYAPVALSEAPAVQVVVILGGGVSAALPPRLESDLSDAADRVWTGARMVLAGKAGAILVSGGGLGPNAPPDKQPEAEATVPFLLALGVPRNVILLETKSMNTIENAQRSAEQLRDLEVERVALVTSAIHMPRAMHAFRHAGIEPVPVPTDFQGVDPGGGPMRFLPSAGALAQNSAVIKEMIGMVYYRVRYPVATETSS